MRFLQGKNCPSNLVTSLVVVTKRIIISTPQHVKWLDPRSMLSKGNKDVKGKGCKIGSFFFCKIKMSYNSYRLLIEFLVQ